MCSLYPHLPHVKSLATKNSPKIILLSETRTIENMTSAELNIDGYKLFRCDALNRHTGGVVIYLENSISAYEVFKYASDNIWALAINVTKGFSNDIFCVLYRGHQSKDLDFANFLPTLCENLINLNPTIHIIGDINYDFQKNTCAKNIARIAKSYCLKQLVSEPTRVSNTSSSIIDWYLTNKKNVKC